MNKTYLLALLEQVRDLPPEKLLELFKDNPELLKKVVDFWKTSRS